MEHLKEMFPDLAHDDIIKAIERSSDINESISSILDGYMYEGL